jgi:hypothetical protein
MELRVGPFWLKCALIGLGLSWLCSPVQAWGPEGHEVIATIAAANLTPAARAQVSALLGGDSMIVLDANWADEIRADRPDTASWHYVNIPLNASGYEQRRDCAQGQCVVAQIERDEAVLGDRRAPKPARADALRFLIHFIGDVHQPLHAADNGDKGGNAFTVFLRGKHTNLHHVWDNDVVDIFGRDAGTVAFQINSSLSPAQKAQDSGGAPAGWANESLAAARGIYGQIRNPNLPRDYAQRQSGLTRDRLARAGLRLAAVLNRILR